MTALLVATVTVGLPGELAHLGADGAGQDLDLGAGLALNLVQVDIERGPRLAR